MPCPCPPALVEVWDGQPATSPQAKDIKHREEHVGCPTEAQGGTPVGALSAALPTSWASPIGSGWPSN